MGFVRNVGASAGHDTSDSGELVDKFGYMADLLRELHMMADEAGARQLAALIALAQVEASRCAAKQNTGTE